MVVMSLQRHRWMKKKGGWGVDFLSERLNEAGRQYGVYMTGEKGEGIAARPPLIGC